MLSSPFDLPHLLVTSVKILTSPFQIIWKGIMKVRLNKMAMAVSSNSDFKKALQMIREKAGRCGEVSL